MKITHPVKLMNEAIIGTSFAVSTALRVSSGRKLT